MCGLVSERKHAPKSNGKNTAHKARGRESAENAKAGQRAFPRTPAPFLFMFFTCVQRACAWLRRPSAKREGLCCGNSRNTMHKSRTCLCKHTPRCQTVLIDINCCNLFYSNISPIRIQVKLAGGFGQGGNQFIIIRIDEAADFRGVIPQSRFRIVTRGSGTDFCSR